MNNSTHHPQRVGSDVTPVENRGSPSTGNITRNPRGHHTFRDMSTIHTPYYDYSMILKKKESRRRGSTCAYPS